MRAALAILVVLMSGCAEPEPIVAERVTTTYADVEIPIRQSRASVLVDLPRPIIVATRLECEIGAKRQCGSRVAGGRGPHEVCVYGEDGLPHFTHATCNTPLAISFDGAPVSFTHVAADFHVGTADRTEWISSCTPWLDRDGNGCIDSERELFAGFGPLAMLDANVDGVLDVEDPAFAELVTWSDTNQDKRCTPDEVKPLTLPRIPLAAIAVPAREGSFEGEYVTVDGARIVDVYLADDPSR